LPVEVRKVTANKQLPWKMEEVSVEVVLSEAGVNRENENDLTIF
jgi:hypothetical protein